MKQLNQLGKFDCVFIDGDHTWEGVKQDTELALSLIHKRGSIIWHDVNISKKTRYRGVRDYLVEECPLTALATLDLHKGGIAVWNRNIEKILKKRGMVP